MFKKIEMNFLEANLRLGTNALFLVVERSNPATVNFFFLVLIYLATIFYIFFISLESCTTSPTH